MTPALVVVGLNHTTAPVEVREQLAVPDSMLPQGLADLLATSDLSEAVILTTCNRAEVWGVEGATDAGVGVARWLEARSGLGADALASALYVRRGPDAVAHMARVAAGIDSMVVGEPQILGQVKAAYAGALAHGAAGPVLADAVAQVFRIAKRVRTETDVGRGAVSVSYAAVELARRIFGDLRERGVVLIGAGEMGALAARHLADLGVSRLVIASRTVERAEAIARETGGKAVAFDEFPRHAAAVDIVICAATAPGLLVTRAQVEGWVRHRPRPLFLIDVGVPRNVERAAGEIADVYLYDIDDLQSVVEANSRTREREVERAQALITEAVANLERRVAARTAAPMIRSLRAKIEEVRRAEVERAAGRLRNASPEARDALETMSVALVNKILHGPIEQLKAAQSAPGGRRLRRLVRDLFGLSDAEGLEDEVEEP